MLVKKLKSNRGMSILMGLLLFLVCCAVGAAALTSAASNAGRYTHLRQDQQRYLSVASAARLVRDELCQGSYTASASLTERYEHYSRTHTNPETGAVSVSWYTEGPYYNMDKLFDNSYTGLFSPWLRERLDMLFQAQEVEENWWSLGEQTKPANPGALEYSDLDIQLPGEGADSILNRVKWRLTMGENYALNASFWVEETDKDGNISNYYTTTLTIPAVVTFSENTVSNNSTYQTRTTTTRTMTVTWPLEGAVIRQS